MTTESRRDDRARPGAWLCRPYGTPLLVSLPNPALEVLGYCRPPLPGRREGLRPVGLPRLARVPELDRAVAAAAGEEAAVGAEDQALDPLGVRPQREHLLAGPRVP